MLEFEEYKTKLNALRPALDDLGEALQLHEAEREIAELETESAQDGFWNNVQQAPLPLRRCLYDVRDGP